MKKFLAVAIFLAAIPGVTTAQNTSFCSTHPEKLACVLSGGINITGKNSPVGALSGVSAAIGSQLGLVPLASPASGIIYSTDPSLGVLVPSGSESFGPVLTERGETISRRKIFVAFTYQRFGFNSIDDVNLKDIPIVFDASTIAPGDLATTSTRADVKLNQFAFFATYGISSRLDASIAVPIINAKVSSTITCGNVTTGGGVVIGTCAFNGQRSFSQKGDATGIGDIVLRLKGSVWKGERLRVAAGVDLRVPTGDELNFLGTGAVGVKPFVAASVRGRVAPHVNLGYQWNGNSDIASLDGPGVTGKLPNNFFYNAGADIRAAKRLTVAVDFLGEHVFDAIRVFKTQPAPGDYSIVNEIGSFNTARGSAGVKINPIGHLLITANVLFKMEHNGLKNQPVPLVGISYTF